MRRVYFWIVALGILGGCSKHDDPVIPPVEEYHQIRLMTYNVLYSTSNDPTLDVLMPTGADIIGMQEISPERLFDLAQRLNFQAHSFSKSSGNLSDQDTGILSRYPITGFFDDGVIIRINPLLDIAVFTVHLSPYPYQPYDFRDGVIQTAQQAVDAASSERLPEINPVLGQISGVKAMNIPVFLTGDFNEPSHLDWTASTASKHFDKVVEWPVSKSVANAGLFDVYRSVFPSPANFPGITWTTIPGPDEVYDRIDIIYQSDSTRLKVIDARLVGGNGNGAGITVTDYPSDHFAVMTTYTILK